MVKKNYLEKQKMHCIYLFYWFFIYTKFINQFITFRKIFIKKIKILFSVLFTFYLAEFKISIKKNNQNIDGKHQLLFK